jgi:RNA polymerase sigma-70 factor (ECF subfamily)
VARAVLELPDEQREVFLMRTLSDMPFKEVARVQRVSINTALARMQYALSKLRAGLGEGYANDS